MLKSILLLILSGLASWSMAQVTVPSDVDYFTISTPQARFIFSEDRRPYVPELVAYSHYFLQAYAKSFNWRLDEKPSIALLSERNQIPNAFATVMPFTESIFFPTPGDVVDYFSSDHWIITLTSHELAHLYQLNAKGNLSSVAKYILGNTAVTFVLVPIFIHPNMFTPSVLLEGNAVLNESVIGHGGRLWNGAIWAEVLAQVQAGDVYPARLFNPVLQFPFNREKYHQGGFFFAHLARTYGLERSNQFFLAQGQHSMVPFILNKTFRTHFGKSYSRLIYDYKESLMASALAQQQSSSAPLISAVDSGPMNHDSEKVYLMVNRKGVDSQELIEIDKRTRKTRSTAMDLPVNKLFLLADGEYYGRASYNYDPVHIRYSLYGQGMRLHRDYLSKVVLDQRSNHLAYFAADQSSSQPALFIDDQFLGPSASSAILDEQGHIYYFRQDGPERILYRDREPMVKFRGYYSFPIEVDDKGRVLFIAPTAFGSSIFAYSEGQIDRLSPSDTIVDARTLTEEELLIREVGSDGYAIKIVKEDPKPQSPHFFDLRLPTLTIPSPDSAVQTTLPKIQSYWIPLQLRRSSTDLALGGGFAAASTLIIDPMMYSALNLNGSYYDPSNYEDGPNYTLYGKYTFLRHRLAWHLGSFYNRDSIHRAGERVGYENDSQFFVGATYPLFKWRRLESDLTLDLGFESDEDYLEPKSQAKFGRLAWAFQYARQMPLGFDPFRYFNFTYGHKELLTDHGRNIDDSVNSASLKLSGSLGSENYLGLDAFWGLAERDSIDVTYLKRLNPDLSTAVSFTTEGDAREVRQYYLTYKKAFSTPYYFARFPISLVRLAPLVKAGETYTRLRATGSNSYSVREGAVGVQVDFALLHMGILRATFGSTFSSKTDASPMFMLNKSVSF